MRAILKPIVWTSTPLVNHNFILKSRRRWTKFLTFNFFVVFSFYGSNIVCNIDIRNGHCFCSLKVLCLRMLFSLLALQCCVLSKTKLLLYGVFPCLVLWEIFSIIFKVCDWFSFCFYLFVVSKMWWLLLFSITCQSAKSIDYVMFKNITLTFCIAYFRTLFGTPLHSIALSLLNLFEIHLTLHSTVR